MTSLAIPFASPLLWERSRRALWTGRARSGFALAFLAWDTLIKLTLHSMAVEGSGGLALRDRRVLSLLAPRPGT